MSMDSKREGRMKPDSIIVVTFLCLAMAAPSWSDSWTTENSGSVSVPVTTSVGIGSPNPQNFSGSANQLVVNKAGSNAGITIATDPDRSGAIFFADGTSGNTALEGFLQYSHNGNKMLIGTSAATRMTIDGNGQVGIGTTTPSNMLDVVGGALSQSVNSNSVYLNGTFRNTSTGNTALSILDVGESSTANLRAQYYGSGFSSVAYNIAASGMLTTGANATGGMTMLVQAAAPFRIYTSGTERYTVSGSGTHTFTGPVSLSSTFGVSGHSTLGSVTIQGNGALFSSSANQIIYANESNHMISSGNLAFNGSILALTGAQTISSTLKVTGHSTLGGVTIQGNAALFSSSANQIIYANGSNIMTSSGNLAFNGSTLALAGSTSLEVGGEGSISNLKIGSTANTENLGLPGGYIGFKGLGNLPAQDYALCQLSNGYTRVNASAGAAVTLGVNNSPIVTVNSDLVTVDTKLKVTGILDVGTVVATNWQINPPDYVFEKNYNLASLEKVESFVKKNKHLPEVPSAKEMKKEGVDLVKMNFDLLKKVEELTLYAIEQDKRDRKHEQEIKDLRKIINQMAAKN